MAIPPTLLLRKLVLESLLSSGPFTIFFPIARCLPLVVPPSACISINCNLNYIIYNLLDSPDQDLLVINLHIAFICACFRGILQTFKKCQTLGQFFESLYIMKTHNSNSGDWA